MADLAVFGCSQTNDFITSPSMLLTDPSWGSRLATKLGLECKNYARPGYDNTAMFQDITRYIALGNKPKYIIVQWTECFRRTVCKKSCSANFKIDDVLQAEEEWELDHSLKHLIIPFPADHHETHLPDKELTLFYTYHLQQMARLFDVDIRFMSFHDLTGVVDSPVYDMIDHDKWLHEVDDPGWLSHLLWTVGQQGVRWPDPHMSDLGADFTADSWFDYLSSGNKILTLPDDYLTNIGIRERIYHYVEME